MKTQNNLTINTISNQLPSLKEDKESQNLNKSSSKKSHERWVKIFYSIKYKKIFSIQKIISS